MSPQRLCATSVPIDLLVIGGGTAGRQAAMAAAEAGLTVHLVTAQEATTRSRDSVHDEGVQLHFEHSALALLRDAGGRVCGTRGVAGPDELPWWQAARAVVLATGRSPTGLLLASEAGAQLQPDSGDGAAEAADGSGRSWQLGTEDAAGDSGVPGLWITGRAAGAPRALGLLPPDSLAAQLLAARRTGLAAAAWIDEQPALHDHGLGMPAQAPAVGRPQAASARPAGPVLDPQAARQTLAAVLGTLALARPGDSLALRTACQQVQALWQFLSLAGEAPRGRQRSTRDALARVDLARRALAWQLEALQSQPAEMARVPTPASTPVHRATLQAYAR